MDSHSYKHVHDKTNKNMDTQSYRNVHDEKPYILIWIVIRTNMYMTKTHTKTYVNMDIQSSILYMTKHTIELISTRKMMKFHSK